MAGDNVLEITDANFQSEVLDSEQLTLVDFWAPWCGPCRMLAPTIDEIAKDFAGKVKIGKLNIDNNPGIPSMHNISSIPTVLMFKGGQIVDKFVGVVPKVKLSSSINLNL